MEEIKSQLKFFSELLDSGFEFTKTTIGNKTIYYVLDDEKIPVIELGVYLNEEE